MHVFVKWCSDYLRHRKQGVKIEEEVSSCIDIISGVPQGSIIAPFLFCLQMSTAKSLRQSSLTMKYADDILFAIPICQESDISQMRWKIRVNGAVDMVYDLILTKRKVWSSPRNEVKMFLLDPPNSPAKQIV